jgi:hypothetical protein
MSRLLPCIVWPIVLCVSSCGVRLMPVYYPCEEGGREWPHGHGTYHEWLLSTGEASVEIYGVTVEKADQNCRAFVSVEFVHADQAGVTHEATRIGEIPTALYEKAMTSWLRNLASQHGCRRFDVRIWQQAVSSSRGWGGALNDLRLERGVEEVQTLPMDACLRSEKGHWWRRLASRHEGEARN